MINFRPPETRTRSSVGSSSSVVTAEKALSFISKGWQEVRSSADADLQLIKNRANSFKNLADRELENFINSASKSPFTVPTITASATTTPAEIEFVKKLRPKLSEFRRAYSSPEFKWPAQGKLRIDLSAIKNVIVAEVEEEEEDERERWRKWRRERFKEEGQFGEFNWEPIKAFKTRLRELEVDLKGGSSSSPVDIFEGIKNSEFVVKVKSSLKSICKEPEETKGVPPLDVPELLAYLVRQSSPFLDQIGIRRDISEKIVDSLCSKGRSKLLLHSLPEGGSSLIEGEIMNDELDLRIASVLQSTGHCYEGGFWGDSTKPNLSGDKRHVAIVTTASLPWMTGTAVNPLFRAAYLAKLEKQNVTLLVPWLCKSDQELVYPNQLTFSSPEDQELYIRNWLEERIGFKANFKISFYPGKFSKERRSIMPAGDTSQFIPSRDADIAILEEPEHLNWYHHGKRWTDKFNHVVGIVHTNYLEYIKREKNGALQAFFVKHVNNLVSRAYCDKVLRLSAATQDLPKSLVCNVHGVNPKFLKIGEKAAADRQSGQQVFSKGAYFLGKMVWAKGYRELIDLLANHKTNLDGFNLDVYGNGEDAHEVQSTAKRLNLNVNFMKGRDHADDSLHGYKVFINPSISDVLCTATAEALAMGKFVVCADHPSNEFFQAFPNCLTYRTPDDFVSKVQEAMSSEPQPLTPDEQYKLSWEAATQRFMEYSDLDKVLTSETSLYRRRPKGMGKSVSMPNLEEMVDGGMAFVHNCFTGNEFLRLCTGAIPRSRDYDKEHCKDLHLLPPQVENPIYGW
ncbi:digalactosyldiacylglycerol synthase 1, chloroplastic [Nicotiana tabacum]|uniref:Digalactosyldiacylglycerol synthase 1, chloroplastic n=2 Tax=Nicotiana TaxID=4085 RepID=A0A1S3ZGP5_TOBAC|nr:PREDICTED: digalactosyldiacylglycerol synthase 1, chloroplastic-like [Nicotiana sylvestris]XP_016463640.1 PREDICTED: digalactosyldiacylglycerol synthase 1, chloroplastic-like [Nicotiana tabacum]